MKNLIFITSMFLGLCTLQAQNIPLNPNVIYGQLDNGFTYYIEQNNRPTNRVEFRLAINVGSIVEDEDQLGLAHFMEHMNFNGTKNFPGNQMIDNLQNIGVRFGRHLNAYTGFDETVYILPIPIENPGNLDIGMKIIEDWAFNAILSDAEINKERGVILEELRLGLGADKRMLDEYLPKTLYNSHYAKRLPIGKREIIENFDPEIIRRFHRDWYRPDLMALVVVGDIDPKDIETRIKEQFSKYRNPQNKRERIVYEIPNHKETLIAISADPEASFSRVHLYYKDVEKTKTVETKADYKKIIIKSIFSHMLNRRLNEIANSPNPPFTYAGSYHGDTWARTKQAYQSYAMTSDGKHIKALKTLLEENERVRKFGFTQSEFDRSKNEIKSWIEKSYNDRDKTESNRKVTAYLNHFLKKQPAPGIEWEYKIYQETLPVITLNEVNNLIKNYIQKENRVVVITGPEKEGLTQPTEEEVLKVLNSVDVDSIRPYEDEENIDRLVKNLPAKGEIVKIEQDPALQTIIWTLSNNAKVTFKITDFKNDEILFRAVRLGGNSTLSDEDFQKTKWAYSALSEAGMMGYSKNDLDKYLSGKQVYINPGFGATQLSFSGQTTPRNLETLFELIYANFTGMNKDKIAFDSYVTKQKSFYSNLMTQPQFYFMLENAKFIAGDNPRKDNLFPSEEDWQQTDYDLAYHIFNEKLQNAGDFNFIFIGNINEDELKEFSEKYLAVLPSNDVKENFQDLGYRPIKGTHFKEYFKGNDPKSFVDISYFGETIYDEKEDLAMDALAQVIGIKLIEKLREEESGTYTSSVSGGLSKIPYGNYNFRVFFPCGPENVDRLIDITKMEIERVIKNGPDPEDLHKFKTAEINEYADKSKENRTWMNVISSDYSNPETKSRYLNFLNNLENLTVKDVQNVARKYLTKDFVQAVLYPESIVESRAESITENMNDLISNEEVLSLYYSKIGGKDKIKNIKTSKLSMDMIVNEMTLNIELLQMDNDKFKNVLSVLDEKIITIINSDESYKFQKGLKSKMSHQEVEENKKQSALAILRLPEMKDNVKTFHENNHLFYVLESDDYIFTFDAVTGLLIERKNIESGVKTMYSFWKGFDGILYPTKIEIKNNGQNIIQNVKSLLFNKEVRLSDFN